MKKRKGFRTITTPKGQKWQYMVGSRGYRMSGTIVAYHESGLKALISSYGLTGNEDCLTGNHYVPVEPRDVCHWLDREWEQHLAQTT